MGFDTGRAKVPIVVSAILFDLGVGSDPTIRPDAECGYRAAQAASSGPVAEGNVGAGAGATVGKLAGVMRQIQTGYLYTYAFAMIIGLTMLLGWLIWFR